MSLCTWRGPACRFLDHVSLSRARPSNSFGLTRSCNRHGHRLNFCLSSAWSGGRDLWTVVSILRGSWKPELPDRPRSLGTPGNEGRGATYCVGSSWSGRGDLRFAVSTSNSSETYKHDVYQSAEGAAARRLVRSISETQTCCKRTVSVVPGAVAVEVIYNTCQHAMSKRVLSQKLEQGSENFDQNGTMMPQPCSYWDTRVKNVPSQWRPERSQPQ